MVSKESISFIEERDLFGQCVKQDARLDLSQMGSCVFMVLHFFVIMKH